MPQEFSKAVTSKSNRRGMRKSWLILLVVSICLTLAVPFLLGGRGQFRLLRHLSWWAAVLFTLLMVISWIFNALRTKMLMQFFSRSVGFGEAALVTISAEFAGVTAPGSVGMAATYTFLFHNLGMHLGGAVGLVGLIVVTDLAFFGTTMPLAVVAQVFEGVPHFDMLSVVIMMAVVIGGGAVFLWILMRYYREIYQVISRMMARVEWLAKRRYRVARVMVEFIHSMRLLGQMSWPQRFGLYLVTLGFWLPRYLVLVLVIYLVGETVPFSYTYLVQGVLNLGGQVFILPGGAGTVDAGYAAFMSPYMNAPTIAFTLLVWRTFNFYWYLVVGGPIFLVKTGEAGRDLLSQRTKK